MQTITAENLHEKDVLLFINGLPPEILPDVSLYKRIYCTDGAYTYLVEKGIQPDVVSGDFDSLDIDTIAKGTSVVYTPDQDKTDFEKAIALIKNDGFKSVAVYGCSGLEQDHFLGNINSMVKSKDVIEICCFDDYGFYFFAKNTTIISGFVNHIISLVPFAEVTGIISEGVKYPLHKETLTLTNRIGTRNTIVEDTVKIAHETGNLLLFVQRKH
ncbi:thiamine diphosphokinase [Neptunitalea lumnitzerae]|uniref:Thiamine diphosphokinase n=1 Tax=Neptunitalea lumnitzerae TaxID=2965509 RepID=A0ABQ5MJR6_9FLAO|nr:thiamine diphosphokinase [Neptunitalea sp. Y10]GLB49648.1 thiamine pyrophosphokinase [Neptunitalea sp. Y10]